MKHVSAIKETTEWVCRDQGDYTLTLLPDVF